MKAIKYTSLANQAKNFKESSAMLTTEKIRNLLNPSLMSKNIKTLLSFTVGIIVFVLCPHHNAFSQPCDPPAPECNWPMPNPCYQIIRVIAGNPGTCNYCDRIPIYFEGDDCAWLTGQSVHLRITNLNTGDSNVSFGHGRETIDLCSGIRVGGYKGGYPGFSLPPGNWKVKAFLLSNPSLFDELIVNFDPAVPMVSTNAVAKDVSCIGCTDGEISVNKSVDICHFWSVQLFKDFTIPYGSYQFQYNEDSYLFPGLPPGPYRVKFYYFENFHSQHDVYINEPFEADLTIGIEGHDDPDLTYYINGTANANINDTAQVLLRNVIPPFEIVDSSKSAIGTDGNGTFHFYNALNYTPYYIVVKHRNSIETWSSSGVIFSSNTFNYNFTTGADKAYGNNMVLIGDKYRFYSGDVNQDGVIDLEDLTIVYNDASTFVTGYVVTDLTGDDVVDLEDLLIAYENSSRFISVRRPY